MQHVFSSLFLLLIGITLSACQNKKNGPDPEKPAADEAAVVNAEYLHLTGTLGDQPVTFDLVRRDAGYGDNSPLYSGYYFYNAYENPIPLFGRPQDDSLTLTEPGNFDADPPTLVGALPAADGFRGEWRNPQGTRVLPFRLEPSYDKAIRFRARALQDSMKLMPEREKSPVAYFNAQWLEADSGNGELDAFLNNAIRSGMVGDSLARVFRTTEEAVRAYRNAYFERYREEAGGLVEDGLADTTEFFGLNYDETLSMDVLYNSDSLLTIGYTIYYYSGGAHGNYGTSLRSYDLRERAEITIEDVLRPDYETAIEPALQQAVRQRYNLGENAPLTEILFEETVGATENFGLTGKGIIFNYPPYAIAPYAAGEVVLFIPFGEITELLQQRFRR